MRLTERRQLNYLSSSVKPREGVSNKLDSLAEGNLAWASNTLCFTFSIAPNSSPAKQQARLEDTTRLDAT